MDMAMNTGLTPSVASLVALTDDIIRSFGPLTRGVAKETVQRCLKLRDILRGHRNVDADHRYETIMRGALLQAREIAVRWKQKKGMKKLMMRKVFERNDEEVLKRVNAALNNNLLASLPGMFEGMRRRGNEIDVGWNANGVGGSRRVLREWEIDPGKPLITNLGEEPIFQGSLGYVFPVTRDSVKLGRKPLECVREDFEEHARILQLLKPCENIVTFEGAYWDERYHTGNMLLRIVESERTLEHAVANHELVDKPIWQATILCQITNALSFCVSFNPHVVVQNLHPKSILLDVNPNDKQCPFVAKICDFSTADTAQESRSVYVRAVDHRSLYEAPEKRSNSKITTKVDVWSFGWIVYFVCTGGKHPPSDLPYGTEPLKALDLSGIDPLFAHVIHKCLLLRPGDRANCNFLYRLMKTITSRIISGQKEGASIIENPKPTSSPGVSFEEQGGMLPRLETGNPQNAQNTQGNNRRPLLDLDGINRASQMNIDEGQNTSSPPSSTRTSNATRPVFSLAEDVKTTVTPATGVLKENGEDDLEIGKEYLNGLNGRGRDERLAEQHFQKAVEAGNNPIAMNILGKLIMNKSTSSEANRAAFLLFQNSAALNYPAGMVSLGYCYEMSKGTAASRPKAAAEWYMKAANEGHAGGMCNFARCLETGFGVAKNKDQSVQWYAFAARQGNYRAMCSYGYVMEELKYYQEAQMWYRKAADANYPRGSHLLALCYERGTCGLKKDIVQAKDLYGKAADLNYKYALRRIGLMHERGEAGLLVNYVEARTYFEKAIRYGDASSSECLARIRQKMMGRGHSKRNKLKFFKANS